MLPTPLNVCTVSWPSPACRPEAVAVLSGQHPLGYEYATACLPACCCRPEAGAVLSGQHILGLRQPERAAARRAGGRDQPHLQPTGGTRSAHICVRAGLSGLKAQSASVPPEISWLTHSSSSSCSASGAARGPDQGEQADCTAVCHHLVSPLQGERGMHAACMQCHTAAREHPALRPTPIPAPHTAVSVLLFQCSPC